MNLNNFRMLFSAVFLCALWSVQSTCAMFELEEDNHFPQKLYEAIQRKDNMGVAKECQKLDRQAINVPDRSGKTALAYAIEADAIEIVRTLVEMGARVNQKVVRKSPLMLAVEGGKIQLVQMLAQFGALCDDYGSTLRCAVKSRNIDMVNVCLGLPAEKASEVRKKAIEMLESYINSYRCWQRRQRRVSTGAMHEVIDDYERIRDLIDTVEKKSAPKTLIAEVENRVPLVGEQHNVAEPCLSDVHVLEKPQEFEELEEADSNTGCAIQ